VQMAKKQKSMNAPTQARRASTTGLSRVTLPEMPTMPTMVSTDKMSSMTGGVPGLGTVGLGARGGGGPIPFFGLRGGTNGFIGTFYDLKQTKDQKPTDMAGPLNEKGANDRSKEFHLNLAAVKKFTEKWDESVLSEYYKAPASLSSTQFYIPNMPSDAATKEFGVEKVCKGRHWIIHYTANVVPPKDGTFRFVGNADDILMVRWNGKTVLDGNLPNQSMDLTVNTENKIFPPGASSRTGPWLNAGTWIPMRKGEAVPMEVILGENPGGRFYAYLLIEEKGVQYEKGVYSLFQVQKGDVPTSGIKTAKDPIIFGVKPARSVFRSRL